MESVISLYENSLVYLATDNDTVPAYKDSLITYLQSRNDYRAKLQLIPMLINMQDMSEAQLQLNELDYLTQNMPVVKRQYMLDFIDLQNLIMTFLPLDSTQQDSIILTNVSLLQSIAGNELNPYQIDAVLLLEQVGLDSLQLQTPLPDPMANKNMEIFSQLPETEPFDMDWSMLLEIYPNPVNNELSVEYALLEKGNYRLAVFDLNGKLLFSKPVTETFGLVKISTGNLVQGNYIISLTSNNKPSKISKQFSVVH